jgi:hypothetical protein
MLIILILNIPQLGYGSKKNQTWVCKIAFHNQEKFKQSDILVNSGYFRFGYAILFWNILGWNTPPSVVN